MKNIPYLLILIISAISMLFLLRNIRKNQKNKKQIYYAFISMVVLMLIWTISLIAQILCQNTAISPVYFEYTAAFGGCFISVAFFFLALIFSKTKINFKLRYLLLFIIPILSTAVLWTNDSHHLFYITYTTNTATTVFGQYFPVHSIYTFLLFGISIFFLLRSSFKNSGFFSRQSIFIVIGVFIPLAVNMAGLLGIPSEIYITPISFTFTLYFFALAVFRFGLMKISPIAIQTIVDRISDGYLILDEENVISDYNQTIFTMFDLKDKKIRGKNLFTLLEEEDLFSIDKEKLTDYIKNVRNSTKTFHFERKLNHEEKYFNIELNSITNEGNFLGTLMLFKDTTQHIIDMQTIQDNQQLLMERERLASLGQLIGGIAHNLKTPIMSIAGGAEGLSDLVKEYNLSIDNPNVTKEDHHAIAKDMEDWIEKIKSYTEYMSDVITAVKGQAVTLSEEQKVSFDVDELVKRINILMKHELKNALINLNISINTDSKLMLNGNIVSLVQVVNNMISNSIQAYGGAPNKDIDLIVSKDNDNLIISIQDYAGGIPQEVQNKLFKEMITTKGKNGTGLGLFMSYSTIRAHFNGNISFETEEGKGTKFNISIPI